MALELVLHCKGTRHPLDFPHDLVMLGRQHVPTELDAAVASEHLDRPGVRADPPEPGADALDQDLILHRSAPGEQRVPEPSRPVLQIARRLAGEISRLVRQPRGPLHHLRAPPGASPLFEQTRRAHTENESGHSHGQSFHGILRDGRECGHLRAIAAVRSQRALPTRRAHSRVRRCLRLCL